jgi:hypothetical protein
MMAHCESTRPISISARRLMTLHLAKVQPEGCARIFVCL